MARSSDRSKERRWIRLLQEKQVSGESVAACCRKRQIPAHQFYWWQRQLRHRDAQDTDEQPLSPASFVPVRVSLVEPMIEVVHAGGCIVRVVAGVDDLRKGSRCRSAAVRPSHRPFTVSPSPVAKREQQRTSSRQRTNPDGLQRTTQRSTVSAGDFGRGNGNAVPSCPAWLSRKGWAEVCRGRTGIGCRPSQSSVSSG